MTIEQHSETEKQDELNENKFQFSLTTSIISLLITLPIFLIISNTVPNLYWPLYIDSIILFSVIWGLAYLLVYSFKKLTYAVVIIMLIILLIGSISNKYGFVHFVSDYSSLISNLKNSDAPLKALQVAFTPGQIAIDQILIDKIFVTDDITDQSAALGHNFDLDLYEDLEIQKMVRAFSIFKSVKSNWIYIKDNNNYTSNSEEVLNTFSGDFDDYTIFLCALLEANQNRIRIIRSNNVLHPELLIGESQHKQFVRRLIKTDLFKKESFNQDIIFHTDPEGRVWVSLSYYGNFPGRRLFNASAMEYEVITVGNNSY